MGQLVIPSFSTIYVDTSVVIYTVEGDPDYYSLLQPLWAEFQAGEVEIVSSELTLMEVMEVLVVPIRNGNSFLITDYEQLLLSSRMQLIPISQFILRQAATLRATNNIKTPDAIHAVTALSTNCAQFITNDRGFRNVANLPVVVLSEVLAP